MSPRFRVLLYVCGWTVIAVLAIGTLNAFGIIPFYTPGGVPFIALIPVFSCLALILANEIIVMRQILIDIRTPPKASGDESNSPKSPPN